METSKQLKTAEKLARISMAIVFIWFGSIKVIGMSPANELVESLLNITLPFIPFSIFIVFLGIWEALIGLLFLFPKMTKIAFWLLAIQMFTTFGPLLFLPDQTWQMFAMVPTLAGQYILKNFVLVSMGWLVYKIHQLKV